jgi:FkbM family methyltransferase
LTLSIKSFIQNRLSYRRFGKVIAQKCDIEQFLNLWKVRQDTSLRSDAVPLSIRQLNGQSVWVRPGTSDVRVLWDCFFKQYQLPPMPIDEQATILDLGANVGYTAASLGVRFPKARIIGVELDAANVIQAKRNTTFLGDRCTIVHAGIWHELTTIAYEGHTEHALHISDAPADHASHTVQTITMPMLMERFGIDHVDYVKMDIEGAEAHVLENAVDVSWLSRIINMNVEVHKPATIQGITEVLRANGFDHLTQPTHWSAVIAGRSHGIEQVNAGNRKAA